MTYEAKFNSTCAQCWEAIIPGEILKWSDIGSIHDACEGDEPERPIRETCTGCWLIKPCECDQ